MSGGMGSDMATATRVIKVGGRPQSDPSLASAIARAWSGGERPLVLVHGGGDEVSALQTALGSVAQFVGGRRVTSAQDVEIVRMALSGSANKRLVASLARAGVNALGLSGEDAALIGAEPLDPARLGHVGTPRKVNVGLLRVLLDGGWLPVVSPVSRNLDERGELGAALNVNGDDAAAAIAVAVGATELLLVSDVPGVLVGGEAVAQLDAAGARRLLDDGTARGGMGAKIQSALSALDGGVERVRIGDIAAIDDEGRGTVVVRELVMA